MVNRKTYASNTDPTNAPNTESPHNTTVITFNDIETAFASKSMKELMQGYLIFSLCSIRYLTANGPKLYNIVHRTFGTTITNFLIKYTFFNYFCLGQSTDDIKPTIKR
uniref:Proline dehydrogenase n=1 Tax=Lygus hesperus TaxID=30085 RepID=A0A0A9XTJ3_LYGHE